MSAFERMRRTLSAWPAPGPLVPSVLLQVDEPLRGALRLALRQGSINAAELAERLGLDDAQVATIAELLVACGFLEPRAASDAGPTVYHVRHATTRRPGAAGALWDRLAEREDADEG